ncbi:MAG: hypothetical protein FJX29_07780 [Alphaproteobacteria bacterium]|nr:hypothetical protein [Alphaproteobacteria bacterium]
MNGASSFLARSAMTLVMLAIFTVMVAIAWPWPDEARFMPLVVGVPGIGLCLLQLLLDWRNRGARQDGSEEDIKQVMREAEEKVSRMTGRQIRFDVAHEMTMPVEEVASASTAARREKLMLAAFLALVAGVIVLGFLVALPVFLVLFLRYIAGLRWGQSLLAAALATPVLFGVFEYVLKAQLYRGLAGAFLGDMFAN